MVVALWARFLLFLADLIPAQFFTITFVQMLKILISNSYLFLSTNCIYLIAFCPLKGHVLPGLFTQTVQVKFIILFFQNYLSSIAPIQVIVQAPKRGSFYLLSSSFTKSSESFSPIILLLSHSHHVHSFLFSLILSLFSLLSRLLLSY